MAENWRIFVVEGEEALNRSLVNSLHKDGYAVQGVMNGADAVRTLLAEEYDVVICDLKTPGADGFELLQWLRVYRPNTHMIMVGSPDSEAQRLQAFEGGAVSYLAKPVDFHLLKDELRRLLLQTGFSASLESFDLLDVIQIITSMNHKNITLLINTGLEERGILHFQNGEMIWAEYGVLRGEEAFFALAAHKNGTVTHQPWDEQIVANVTQPLSRLIFQALQYRTKYADPLQYSGELNAITRTTFAEEELDDSPFTVLQESDAHIPVPSLEFGQQEQNILSAPISFEPEPVVSTPGKEWWEQTGHIAGVEGIPPSSRIADTNEAEQAPTLAFNEYELKKEIEQRQLSQDNKKIGETASRSDLPSWLTDQPTAANIPVIRPSSLSSEIPATPRTSGSSPEWQVPLTSIKTTEQLSLKRPTPAHMPGNVVPFAVTTEQTQQIQPVEQSTPSSELPSISSAKTLSGELNLDAMPEGNPMISTATMQAQRAARRNYTALVGALQTLGYSIIGFVAAAVVSIDGQPIAQVAVDDLDISKLCKLFSTVQKNVLLALDQGVWGDYEDTIITSAEGHILMRIVGSDKKAFQVLITTREANPVESLEVMANVEGAIGAALR